VVPEKQGLKQPVAAKYEDIISGLSSGSRKTRIETRIGYGDCPDFALSKQWFQKNKD